MKKIHPMTRAHLPKPNKIKIQKEVQPKLLQKPALLERTPAKEYFDYSTEERGYFLRRDANGNILEVIQTIFPR